jgi:hypothetical protein
MNAEDRPAGRDPHTGPPGIERDVDSLLEAAGNQSELPHALSKRETLDLQEREIKECSGWVPWSRERSDEPHKHWSITTRRWRSTS